MMLMAMMIPKREADKKDSVLALPLLALPPRLVGDVTVCPKETKNKGIAITPPFFFVYTDSLQPSWVSPIDRSPGSSGQKMRRPRVETGHPVIHALFSRSKQKN